MEPISPHPQSKRNLATMLGKTRHDSSSRPHPSPSPEIEYPESKYEERFDPVVGKARGVLQRATPDGRFQHFRIAPPPDLALSVAHCWMVSWEIEGPEPHLQETVPHPNFHLVFENGIATVSGVHTGKHRHELAGKSFAFGVKFTPGGFRPFLHGAASALANQTVPASQIFGTEVDRILDFASTADERSQAACAFLRARMPAPDPVLVQVVQIADNILRNPDLKTVEDLTAHAGIGKRTLQRIFNDYVGASPKWVIRRYRLHELIERCNSGEKLDFAQIALDLGYFDQAHLINDFRAIVGNSPAQYQQTARHARPKAERRS
jgi:AraC-like DNA-binding protein